MGQKFVPQPQLSKKKKWVAHIMQISTRFCSRDKFQSPLCADQYQHPYSPHYSPYISYVASQENFIKNQDVLSLVIIPFILMTCMFDQVVIL